VSFNPLERFVEHRARKAADKVYAEGHWGTHYTFPVQWSGRHPLVFEMRAPDGVELVDVVALANDARGASAWAGGALAPGEQAVQMPGVVVITAVRGTADPEPQREVLATLAVTFAEPEGPFDTEAYMPKDSASTIKSQQDYHELSEKAWRIHRISGESQGEGEEPLPVLLIEYVWQTKHGLVTLAFATTRVDMMGDKPRELFDQIWQTAYIGESQSLAS
jgi:hypothetical protein